MKINRLNYINNQYLANKTTSNKDQSKNVKTNHVVNVEISDTAKNLINKTSKSSDTGVSERVEAIRQSIISGNYKVSSEDIANKMIEVLDSQKDSGIE